MDISQDNQDSSLLLAHFYKNLISGDNFDNVSLNLKIMNKLMTTGLNINQKFPDNFLASSESTVSGGTLLHFLYSRKFSIKIFNALIERGADFTLKNVNGQTILHCIFEEWRYREEPYLKMFIKSVLSAHVKFQNISNPSDSNGLTHFHCACMVNHTQAIELFLESGVPIDLVVSIDSKLFPGYAGLHFATEGIASEATKILLDSNANAFIENKWGMTPLQAVIKDKQKFIMDLTQYGDQGDLSQTYFDKYDKVISLFLERDRSLTTSFFHFYAACSLQDVSWVERFLEHVPDINQCISMDSSHWPGYTPLHFAAHCSIDMVKLLLEKGANIVAEDARGLSPMNICFRHLSTKDVCVCSVLTNDSAWANTLLSDGKTKLLDLMSNMKYASSFKSFLNDVLDNVNCIVPIDSPIWPGYSCLHVAIAISPYSNELMKICLNYGSDVNAKNARGQTPIHLAYRLEKNVSPLLEHLESLPEIVDILDEDDLSYLHIASAYCKSNLIERLLPTSDVNVTYKGRRLEPLSCCILEWRYAVTEWTPLHFFFGNTNNDDAVIKLLVDAGANVDAKDEFGLTPVHWALDERSSVDALFARDDLKDCVTKFGMSYLHVASATDNRAAVDRLIGLGSKIDAVMDGPNYPLVEPYAWQKFFGFTPLELALAKRSYKAFVGLVKNGASMSSNDFKCTKLLRDNQLFHSLCTAMWNDDEVRDIVEAELGLTKLHVACCCADVQYFKELLDRGANVDARVHEKSKVFAGCTPLNLLMMQTETKYNSNDRQSVVEIIEMLLEGGADVTIANVEGNTPVHTSLELAERKKWPVEEAEKCTTLLMANQRDFTLNPVNADGISHFHVACLVHNVEAVEGFLQTGVDVNQETDFFCEKYAKFSPLHFAFGYPLTKFPRNHSPAYIVDLLLKSGANVQAQDAGGNTPLHEACRDARADIGVLANLISFGADVRKENVRGETPFELLLSSPEALPEQIRLFIKHGVRFNDSNRLSDKGYIATLVFANSAQPPKTIFKKVISITFDSDLTRNERGRTPIHNTVATVRTDNKVNVGDTYREIIDWFIKKDFDIDDQDESGKTALHYAAQFGNNHALYALLELGADINIVDKSGKPAFSYAVDRAVTMAREVSTSYIFFMQVHVRKMIGLEVSQLNLGLYELNVADMRTVVVQFHYNAAAYGPAIEKSKSKGIRETSLTLHDFLVDTKAVANYPFMPEKTRDRIDKFFKSLNKPYFAETIEIFVILKSQYSKAVARVSLIKEASRSLRAHLGFSFPGLCEDITVYLSNADLKNLIKSAN